MYREVAREEWAHEPRALSAVVSPPGRVPDALQRPTLHHLCGRRWCSTCSTPGELDVDRVSSSSAPRRVVTKTSSSAPRGMEIEFVRAGHPARDRDAVASADRLSQSDEEGDVVSCPATPRCSGPTLAALVRHHRSTMRATLLTRARRATAMAGGSGKDQSVARIVEEADATDEDRDVRESTPRSMLPPRLLAPRSGG